MWVTSSTATALTPTAVALGNFDGVHRGHRQVVQPILSESPVTPEKEKELLKHRPLATVVTFNPHPREFFTGQSRKLLTPLAEKAAQLERLGVEQLVSLPFDQEIASLSPQQFVAEILVEQLQATFISVGEDFRFGKNRAGCATELINLAAQFGIEVTVAPLETCASDRISSSLIRQALSEGEIPKANRLLGRDYTLIGQVVTGQKLGRTIGFPTANLQVPADKFLPRQGVYCVTVEKFSDFNTSPETLIGVMNLGCRPTVDGKNPTIEIHLLDWSGDLYGQKLIVSLKQFLRSEQKFPSLDALKAQIATDCQRARKYFSELDTR
ncbi:bifunctional riboflavin kinase/FAD synthetase [Oscillatoria salina]|uniref:bifunctional riboflavin kinase/FAD synthetase n=1 Tax=Oscillatoria salina TaxID=331517 RepID=UPI0013BD64CA|nr:bifunctional riboflavin kinase/FAD synthetase [Oscillatoria salina]MBZ8179505.1 bifunctional riboflavin kinase/FAD synthetase [Oscillatoria salina IIICB1]NET88513.1 bifunctional riboflavin kinase/FAD synthetase [Kamptonema sp. SIO1D9]